MDSINNGLQQICPNCGRCPTCGRSNLIQPYSNVTWTVKNTIDGNGTVPQNSQSNNLA